MAVRKKRARKEAAPKRRGRPAAVRKKRARKEAAPKRRGRPAAERKLRPKQQAFVDAYVGPAKGNGAEACRMAGYKGSPAVLASQARQNLALPHISAAIEARQASASEAANFGLADALRIHLAALSIRMEDVCSLGQKGGIILKSFAEWPDAARDLVRLKVTPSGMVYPELPDTFQVVRELSKLCGLYAPKRVNAKLEGKGEVAVRAGITDELAEDLRRKILGIETQEAKG